MEAAYKIAIGYRSARDKRPAAPKGEMRYVMLNKLSQICSYGEVRVGSGI